MREGQIFLDASRGIAMQIPLHFTFEGLPPSEAVERRVRQEVDKLEKFHDRITGVRAIVARSEHRHRKGDTYSVRLYVSLPGGADIAVDRASALNRAHEDVYVAIRDAFKAARRQIQDLQRRRQGQVKEHAVPPHGVIAALHPDKDHGFIAVSDGREIYFHRNSVDEHAFDQLRVGQEVRFAESVGDKGPQATFVRAVGKHHIV